jgi:NAD(P)-dependent dehydrogenase (short-subunit alcohol dehydrogenase family)
MNVLESFSLRGKTALITGGAGLYGRQIVAALAEAGARVFVASRSIEALEALAAAHRKSGLDVTALMLDQGEESSVLALRDELKARDAAPDILINNAVARPMKNGYNSDAATFAESMRINATGLFLVTRAIGEIMADGGSIINIGSIQGTVGPDPTLYEGTGMDGFVPDYFFHKGGINNFTRFCGSYYGPRGIRCNCINAGGFYSEQNPVFVERYNARTFLGRMAGDEDLKGLIVYLASDASLYMTGACIPLDGGYTAK